MTNEPTDGAVSGRAKQAVAVLLMVVTVIGGVFGVLAERTSDQHVDATRAVEVTSVRMLDERSRAAGRISAEQQAVPEPSALALLVLGAIAVAGRRRWV